MAKIREDIIQQVIDTAKIEEVVGEFVKLRKSGVNMTGLCPFHDDENDGNFIVRPSTIAPKDHGNTYRCFVCDARGDAVKFLTEHVKLSFPDAIRWLGKKYSIEVDNVPIDYTPPAPRPTPPPLPTLTLPKQMVINRKKGIENDNMVKYIGSIKWGNEQWARIAPVLHDYCIGHSTIRQQYATHEFTVFWQIDKDGNVRTAHYMKYKPDGHRVKDKNQYPTDWLHSLLIRKRNPEDPWPYPQYYDPDKQQSRQCLFGEHLLKKYPKATIKLVESEKTAILMAIAYGNNPTQLWLACAGSSNITRERLKPLLDQRRNIILYPDRDGVKTWKQKADGLYYAGISIDARPVNDWWKECDGEKADIADVVIRMINEAPSQPKTIEEVKATMPKAAPLIDKLNLQIQQ